MSCGKVLLGTNFSHQAEIFWVSVPIMTCFLNKIFPYHKKSFFGDILSTVGKLFYLLPLGRNFLDFFAYNEVLFRQN